MLGAIAPLVKSRSGLLFVLAILACDRWLAIVGVRRDCVRFRGCSPDGGRVGELLATIRSCFASLFVEPPGPFLGLGKYSFGFLGSPLWVRICMVMIEYTWYCWAGHKLC